MQLSADDTNTVFRGELDRQHTGWIVFSSIELTVYGPRRKSIRPQVIREKGGAEPPVDPEFNVLGTTR